MNNQNEMPCSLVALRPCSPVASCAQPWLFIRTLAYREGVQIRTQQQGLP